MGFDEVIGQQEIKEKLAEMVHNNRLSHALLLLGKEGSGALPLALAFTRFLVCEKNNPGIKNNSPAGLFDAEIAPSADSPLRKDACGQCPSCIKAAQMVHPDIHYSYPVVARKSGDKPISTDYIREWREFNRQHSYGNVYDWLQFIGAENRQGNITAAECADIIHKLNLKSFESGYKILLMWMPEYLEKEGNKLLKIIEEPPADTLFLLVAENEDAVLPTVLSRCQLVKIPLPWPADIEKALRERATLAPDKARQVAAVCDGNYREALQLIQHAEEDWQALLRDWLNAIVKTGPHAQIKWVDEISKLGRERQKQFLRYFNHLLEQSVRLRILGAENDQAPVAGNELDFILRLQKIADISQQQAIIGELDRASYYIERNANAKMLFAALTIKLYHIIADKSLILTN